MREMSYLRGSVPRLNSFLAMGGRRNRIQMMHDLLVCAKNGTKKSNIMAPTQIGYKSLMHLLKVAKQSELIEECEIEGKKRFYRGKPIMVWQTTDKGLEWARRVWEDYALVMGGEG